VAEAGSHDELLRTRPHGMYAALLKHQMLSDKPKPRNKGKGSLSGGSGAKASSGSAESESDAASAQMDGESASEGSA
jgi:hypothetical protein